MRTLELEALRIRKRFFLVFWSALISAHLSRCPIYCFSSLSVCLALAYTLTHLAIDNLFCQLEPLLFASFVSLLYNGASSNHVVLEMIVCISLIISPDCVTSTRGLLFALYFLTGFDKLNYDWHIPRQSCASMMTIGAFATLGIKDVLGLAAIAPAAATFTEFSVAILSVKQPRLLMILGACFHGFLALPDSPMSVYPFSTLMLPIYVLAAPSACFYARVPLYVPAVAAAVSSWLIFINENKARFEYPDYGLWPIGLGINLVAWTCCFYAAAFHPSKEQLAGYDGRSDATSTGGGLEGPQRTHSKFVWWVRCCSGGVMLSAVGLCPFLGLRTHAAFAMFSNLRTEVRDALCAAGDLDRLAGPRTQPLPRRPRPRHTGLAGTFAFVPPGNAPLKWLGLQRDFVRVLGANSSDAVLAAMQVDLGLRFSNRTLQALELAGLSPRFYIAPPRWPAGPQPAVGSEGLEFMLPLVELRRRLTAAARSGEWSGPAAAITLERHVCPPVLRWPHLFGWSASSEPACTVTGPHVVRPGGGGDAVGELAVRPLGALAALVARFRPFRDDNSPCRH